MSSSFARFDIAPARRTHVSFVPADDYARLKDTQAKTNTHAVVQYHEANRRLPKASSSSACSPNESHASQSLFSTRFGTTLTCNPPKISDSDATLAMRNKANSQLNSKRTRDLLSVCEFSPAERADSLQYEKLPPDLRRLIQSVRFVRLYGTVTAIIEVKSVVKLPLLPRCASSSLPPSWPSSPASALNRTMCWSVV